MSSEPSALPGQAAEKRAGCFARETLWGSIADVIALASASLHKRLRTPTIELTRPFLVRRSYPMLNKAPERKLGEYRQS